MESVESYTREVRVLIASIMQPSFLPWLGYFNLISNSDIFVFLDDVQFEPRSWQHRNRIFDGKKEIWISVPTTRPSGRETLIRDVLINYEHFKPNDVMETLRRVYSKHPFYSELIDLLAECFSKGHLHLSDFNIDFIKTATRFLNLDTKFIISSSLNTSGKKADLLESILIEVEADVLLSPVGSRNYLMHFGDKFPSGIHIQYQEFTPLTYAQKNSSDSNFLASLSLVDCLANVGWYGLKKLI